MLRNWLQVGETDTTYQDKFTVNYVTEKSKIDESTKGFLKDLFVLSTADSQLVESIRKMDGWNIMIDLLVKPILPTDDKFKKGFFGEVLIPKLLDDFFDYIIPLNKLEYSLNNRALPGTDVIGIKVKNNNVISEICYLESKLRTTSSGLLNSANVAFAQLQKDLGFKIPSISTFLLRRLYEKRDWLYPIFYSYLRNRDDYKDNEVLRIGLVCEKGIWNIEPLDKLFETIEQELGKKVIVDVILLENLASLVQIIFDLVGIEMDEIED